MISPRRVTDIVACIEWARDDVRTGKHHRQKRIRQGFLNAAQKQLEAALAELRLLAREAWEDDNA